MVNWINFLPTIIITVLICIDLSMSDQFSFNFTINALLFLISCLFIRSPKYLRLNIFLYSMISIFTFFIFDNEQWFDIIEIIHYIFQLIYFYFLHYLYNKYSSSKYNNLFLFIFLIISVLSSKYFFKIGSFLRFNSYSLYGDFSNNDILLEYVLFVSFHIFILLIGFYFRKKNTVFKTILLSSIIIISTLPLKIGKNANNISYEFKRENNRAEISNVSGDIFLDVDSVDINLNFKTENKFLILSLPKIYNDINIISDAKVANFGNIFEIRSDTFINFNISYNYRSELFNHYLNQALYKEELFIFSEELLPTFYFYDSTSSCKSLDIFVNYININVESNLYKNIVPESLKFAHTKYRFCLFSKIFENEYKLNNGLLVKSDKIIDDEILKKIRNYFNKLEGLFYPLNHKVNIIELPRKITPPISFTGISFVNNLNNLKVTYHELAHQWFGSKFLNCNRSDKFISESIPEYLALSEILTNLNRNEKDSLLGKLINSYSSGIDIKSSESLTFTKSHPWIYYDLGSLALLMLEEKYGKEIILENISYFFDENRYYSASEFINHLNNIDTLGILDNYLKNPDIKPKDFYN